MANIKKIKKLEIAGFRGARFSFVLDLMNTCRSIAIFGDNASGKSTITDALEWFFYDKIEHLWREGCKKEALRNLNLSPKERASVVVEINETGLSSSKSIDDNLGEEYSNTDENFKKYLDDCAKERLILRNKYMHTFIDDIKSEKRKEIEKIIGYEELDIFESTIRKVKSSLKKEVSPIVRLLDAKRGDLLQLLGTTPSNRAEYYQKVNTLIKPNSLDIEVKDEHSLKKCLSLLQERAGEDKLKKRLKMDELIEKLQKLKESYSTGCKKADEFFSRYCALTKKRESIRMLNVEEFLSKGLRLIVEGHVEEDKCPFCFSEVDIDLLKADVEKRINLLSSVRTERAEIEKVKKDLVTNFRESLSNAGQIVSLPEIVSTGFRQRLETFVDKVNEWLKRIEDTISKFETVSEERMYEYQKWIDESSMRGEIDSVIGQRKALGLTEKEEDLIRLLEKLMKSSNLFVETNCLSLEKDVYEKQIHSLAKLEEEFISVQNSALQDALDLMSEDISNFYLFLHPHDNVDTLRLEIVNGGVEFKYRFHGHNARPPQKYLSESHLNSLAIALFLSSVKLFNKHNKFFILDDIVTSFDADHRIRLLRLLKQHFTDYQIILLTHERFWFDIIKRELPSFGWLINEVTWDFDNGVQLKPSLLDQRQLIMQKRSQSMPVGNDIRILLENILKELCTVLPVRVQYRPNDTNAARTPRELWSELKGAIKRHSPSLRDEPLFKNLETTSFLANWLSHDNPSEVSSGDIDVMLEDIDKLESLFKCPNTPCATYVNTENYNQATGHISCRCGQKSLEWKI